ncbi:MAG TPA: arginine deiminase-related protein [Ornithinimicrobium sp.]|uniref:citrulline utilization hydrolase CtlX n=1 Tax=Ornithinimicrobium sp. TaxID=1977084 RepID=UPI002B495607|nr:arginine deiminase-related protein [Ornithinimicrobium sp.]HKJ11514.1 arginine deiminase-related protein [Ornithinimicrobium sp.]
MSTQAPAAVLLIRPHHFTPNPATAVDNAFQALDPSRSAEQIARDAYAEVTGVAETLTREGIRVHVFENELATHPDSVFPNNWFSTHAGGYVAIYPMHSESRRIERRTDIIEMLKRSYRVQEVADYSGLEYDQIFLEGTGAMVLDHVNRVVYAARSNRANPMALERFCTRFGYESLVFEAVDSSGQPIYHTNVMMCIGTHFVIIGIDMVADRRRRAEVVAAVEDSGRELVALRPEQVHEFAGNAIELHGPDGHLLVMSRRARACLDRAQVEVLQRSCRIVDVEVPTIELAGGSVRCMLAGIHLTPRRRAVSGTATMPHKEEQTNLHVT